MCCASFRCVRTCLIVKHLESETPSNGIDMHLLYQIRILFIRDRPSISAQLPNPPLFLFTKSLGPQFRYSRAISCPNTLLGFLRVPGCSRGVGVPGEP